MPNWKSQLVCYACKWTGPLQFTKRLMVGEKTVEREVLVSVTLCVGIADLALYKFCAEQQRSPSQAPPTEEELAEWLGTVLEGKGNRDQVLQAFGDKHCLTSRQTTGAGFH